MGWINTNANQGAEIDTDKLTLVMNLIGDYYRFIVLIICAFFAYQLYQKQPLSILKRVFTTEKLRDVESVNWPQITPVLHLNLVKEDVSKGPWAMALSPMEFSIKHDLLIPPKRDPRFPKAELIATIDEDKARACFQHQMGPRFVSLYALPIHMKALAGIFAARLFEERAKPAQLLAQMSRTSKDVTKIDFTGAEELLNRFKNEKLLKKVMGRHAYILTVMAALIEVGRSDGVLATADFLWLKPYDRTLWYMLNNVGRQTAFSEVAGPCAHFRAEKVIGRRLNTPMIEEAVKALKIYIEGVVYTGDKESWDTIA